MLIFHASNDTISLKEIIFLQIRSFRKANWLATQIIYIFLFESSFKMEKLIFFSSKVKITQNFYSNGHIILPTCFALFYVVIFDAV